MTPVFPLTWVPELNTGKENDVLILPNIALLVSQNLIDCNLVLETLFLVSNFHVCFVRFTEFCERHVRSLVDHQNGRQSTYTPNQIPTVHRTDCQRVHVWLRKRVGNHWKQISTVLDRVRQTGSYRQGKFRYL